MKTNTRKRLYKVTVAEGGKIHATISVTAEGVRDALKKSYEKVCGWQGVQPETPGVPEA